MKVEKKKANIYKLKLRKKINKFKIFMRRDDVKKDKNR